MNTFIPQVLNARFSGRSPPNSVYIGRPSKWGNPFQIGGLHIEVHGNILTREDVIKLYKDYLLYSDRGKELLKDIEELKDKHLTCWCAPLACHGDILLKLANADEKSKT